MFAKRVLLSLLAAVLFTACTPASDSAESSTTIDFVPTSAMLMTPEGFAIESVQITATALSLAFDADPAADVGVGGGAPSGETTIVQAMATTTPMPAMAAVPTGDGLVSDTDASVDMSLPATGAPDTVMVTPAAESGIISPPAASSVVVPPTTPLNAGELDDNAQWNDYLQYRNNYLSLYNYSVRDVDVTQRQRITVTDAQGLPVLGARVMVYDGDTLITESLTYATGQTLFFPSAWVSAQNAQSYRVVVQHSNSALEFTLDPQAADEWQVTLDVAQQQTRQLDVVFLLDATGSMADEISQLQNNILSISSQMRQSLGNVDVRYGLVAYRDRGDEYVTQTYDFVADVQQFQTQLNTVSAGGGGDTPEALNEALRVAIRDMSWRGDDTIHLVFLVADAAPHLDYANDFDYSHEMVAAAWQGIKIFPLASSGLTSDGEFIFRQMAQYTMGHFLFLTYAAGATSGAPGTTRTDLEASEESYTVEQLDDLVLRLIIDEISALDVAVMNAGITPATRTVNTLAYRAAPSSFVLRPAIVPQVVAVSQVAVFNDNPDVRFSVSIPQIIGLVLGSLLIGYSLSLFYRAERRKRKNEEVIGGKKETIIENVP